MTIGHNTDAGQRLQSFVERIERVRADKKSLSADEAAIKAEAKSAGYHGPAIMAVVKIRSQKPHVREENEAILDTYLHAMGMAKEPPLFRQIGNLGVDIASRDSVIEAMKAAVPENGSITIETSDGKPVKLTRGKDGVVTVADVVERPAETAYVPATRSDTPPPPVMSGDEAEAAGAEAYKANTRIIENPFPYGHDNRGRWDAGWRRASGSDGMGGQDDDED